MNNAYFEGQLQNYVATQSDEQVVDRLKEIEGVLGDLETSHAWQVLLRDAERWKGVVDDHWQLEFDDKKLAQMRVAKNSYKFITEFPLNYAKEKKVLQTEMESRLDLKRTEEEI